MAKIKMELGGRETMLLSLGMTFVMTMLDKALNDFENEGDESLDELFQLMDMRVIGGSLFVRLQEELGIPLDEISKQLRGEE
jgi:hypothetical protein